MKKSFFLCFLAICVVLFCLVACQTSTQEEKTEPTHGGRETVADTSEATETLDAQEDTSPTETTKPGSNTSTNTNTNTNTNINTTPGTNSGTNSGTTERETNSEISNGGNGNEQESGYMPIYSVEDLKAIVTGDDTVKYRLMVDLDMNYEEWTPIGTWNSPFAGTFDGNGHSISFFKITAPAESVGLFAHNTGVIENLGVEDFYIEVNHNDVILYVGGLSATNYGTIRNCYATGTVKASSNGSVTAGNLVGAMYYGGTMDSCYTTGEVYATCSQTGEGSQGCYAGGLLGSSGISSVTSCHATGEVRASSNASDTQIYAGGLLGYSASTSLTECYATGDLTVTTEYTSGNCYTGGLVGDCQYLDITNCYATGDVNVNAKQYRSYAGGLIGHFYADARERVSCITNCYARGSVYSTSYENFVGGLLGSNESYTDGSVMITSCSAQGDTEVNVYFLNNHWTENHVGGLIGRHDNGDVSDSWARVDVRCRYYSSESSPIHDNSHDYVGGLIGYSAGNVTACYARGSVTTTCLESSENSHLICVGGLIGRTFGVTTDCYAVGDIECVGHDTCTAGGLIGSLYGEVYNCYATGYSSVSLKDGNSEARVGGLIGEGYWFIATNCFATGDVYVSSTFESSLLRAGGLIGYHDGEDVIIENCYRYSGQDILLNQNYVNSYVPTNTDGIEINRLGEMKSINFQAFVLGWSADVWDFEEGSLPTLKNAAPTN